MTRKTTSKVELKGKARLRSEIVEMARDQHALGMITDQQLQQTTLRMLGRDALPKVPPMTAAEIVKVRKRAGVSQAVFGGFLNVETQTVSMWERGARRPTGTALKLLHVVKAKGLGALR